MPRTPKPSNAPEGTLWFGGDVARVEVCLRLLGDELVPQEITAILRCDPTSAGCKGEPRIGPNGDVRGHRRIGVWIREHKPNADDTVDEAIAEILAELPSDPQLWQSLQQRFKIDLICDITVRGVNQGFELSPDVLKRVAALDIPLGVDIFTEADDEQSEALNKRFDGSEGN
jgi:uncharacterized protein DUF4279